jgi:hypothetical protein
MRPSVGRACYQPVQPRFIITIRVLTLWFLLLSEYMTGGIKYSWERRCIILRGGIRYIVSVDVRKVLALGLELLKTGMIPYVWGYTLFVAFSMGVMCLFSGIPAYTHALQNTSAHLPLPLPQLRYRTYSVRPKPKQYGNKT